MIIKFLVLLIVSLHLMVPKIIKYNTGLQLLLLLVIIELPSLTILYHLLRSSNLHVHWKMKQYYVVAVANQDRLNSGLVLAGLVTVLVRRLILMLSVKI